MPSARDPFTLRAALRRQRLLAIALLALVVILGIGLMGHVPLAGILLILLLVVLAVARAVLPAAAVGALAVRPRLIDVSILVGLALGLVLLIGVPNL